MCLHGHLLRCSRVFTTCFQTGHPSQVASNGNKSECVSAVGATTWICVRYLKLSPEIFLQKKKGCVDPVFLPLSRKCILGCGSCMQWSHFLCFSGLMRRGVPFLSKGQLLVSPEIGCEGQLCLCAAGARQPAHMQALGWNYTGAFLCPQPPPGPALTQGKRQLWKTSVAPTAPKPAGAGQSRWGVPAVTWAWK